MVEDATEYTTAATPEQGQVEPPIQGQAATSMEQMSRTPIQPRKAEYSTPAETVLLHPNMVAPEVQDRDNLQREMADNLERLGWHYLCYPTGR